MGMGLFTGGGAFENACLHVRHDGAAGAGGGTATSGAWRTRTINTVVENKIPGASLASNRVTLPAGQYQVSGEQKFRKIDDFKTRLYDVTNSALLVAGRSVFAHGASDYMVDAPIEGRFSLAGTAEIELQYYCLTTFSTSGMGFDWVGPGTIAVFADLLFWKVG